MIHQKWLNLILSLTGVIYKKKSKLLSSSGLRVIWLFLELVFLEISMLIISFPMYFFITPHDIENKFGANTQEVKVYSFRRKLTFATGSILLATLVIKTAFVFYGTVNSPGDGHAAPPTLTSQEIEIQMDQTEMNDLTQEGDALSEQISEETQVQTTEQSFSITEQGTSISLILSSTEESQQIRSPEPREGTQQILSAPPIEPSRKVLYAPLISVKLPIQPAIPSSYIVHFNEKAKVYQSLFRVRTLEDLNNLKEDLVEKYGLMPEEVLNFFEVAEIRVLAGTSGLLEIDTEDDTTIVLSLSSQVSSQDIDRLRQNNVKWILTDHKLKIRTEDLGSNWVKELKEAVQRLSLD